MEGREPDVPKQVLAVLFVTALVTAQLLAVKILAFGLPVALPVVGDAIIVPAGVLAYAITFLATDCYTELYGPAPRKCWSTSASARSS